MPRSAAITFTDKNGAKCRICAKCRKTKPLTSNYFEPKEKKYFKGVCRDCNNKKRRNEYKKAISNPKTRENIRARQREKNQKYRTQEHISIPKDAMLASCLCHKGHIFDNGNYVYAHELLGVGYFYIGRGVGNRAWSVRNRSVSWKGYVNKHFNEGIIVHILSSGMSVEEAIEEEQYLIDLYGRKFNHTGNLLNLDNSKLGGTSESVSKSWEARRSNPETMAHYRENAKINLCSPEARKKAIKKREQNAVYINERKKRLLKLNADPSHSKKAMQTRSKNLTWLENVRLSLRYRFDDPKALKKHRELMKTDFYKQRHLQGIKRVHYKKTRMHIPKSWGGDGLYYIIFESRTQMCKAMGFNPSKVSEVINGNRNHHRGFIFANHDGDE